MEHITPTATRPSPICIDQLKEWMFTDVPGLFLVLGGFAAFVAGFVKGFGGFGFAMAFTPVFSLLFGHPHEVVFLALVLGAILSVAVIAEVRRDLRRATALPILAGTMIGTPIGIALLGLMSVHVLKLTISAFAVLMVVLRVARLPLEIRRGPASLAIGGFLGGLLNGCTSMGGPIPALLVAMQKREVHESRAILVTFNLLSYLLAIAVALGAGIARPSWLISGIWLLPFAGFGSFLGIRAVQHMPREAFGLFVTGMVGLAGAFGLASVFLH